jgi:hypothetical protein
MKTQKGQLIIKVGTGEAVLSWLRMDKRQLKDALETLAEYVEETTGGTFYRTGRDTREQVIVKPLA